MSARSSTPRVPTVARRLLSMTLPASQRAHWLGDLAEEYARHAVPEHGAARARWWYWRQVLGSLPAALRRRFGGTPGLLPPEPGRDRQGPSLLGGLSLDLRSALRAMRNQPVVAAVAVLTLTLGVGANVAIFAVANATVLRPLPYDHEAELVRFQPEALFFASVNDLARLSERAPEGLRLAAYGRSLLTFTGGAEAEMVRGAVVSADHFDVLGARPLHGRTFGNDEGVPGQDRLLVLEHGFWQRRYGGDVDLIGATTEINGEPWRVIGVMPPTHQPLEPDWEFWRPLDPDPERDGGNALALVARVVPPLTAAQTDAFYREALVEIWAQQDYEASAEEQAAMYSIPLRDWLLGEWRARLLLLFGAVALVLLVACANVGNLLLARAVARRDELGLRTALGAGRSRLVRLLLVEAAVLAGLGAVLGTTAAWALVGAVRGSIPAGVPRLEQIAVDGTALLYAAAIGLAITFALGLLPAWRSSTSSRAAGARRSTPGAAESRLSRVFVAGQVALAVVLVIGAGLLLRSFARLQSVDPGFAAEGVVAVRPAPPRSVYPDDSDVRAYHAQVEAALRGLPGVTEVGGIMFLPMHPGGWWTGYTTDGRADGSVGEGRAAGRIVTDRYFAAMGVRLLAGRAFQPEDEGGASVIVINEALAREAWPGEEAVGRVLESGGEQARVIGVVANVRQQGLATPSHPEIYMPYSSRLWRNLYFTVRVDGDAAAMLPRVRGAVRGLDERVPINNLTTLADVVADSAADARFLAAFMAAFGGISLLLGMIGVYGVTAYAVARRRREVGIRLAMGASRGLVLRRTVVAGIVPVVGGLLLGCAAAAGGSRFLEGALFEIPTLDPVTFAAVPALLLGTALIALWLPARRATRVDPATVLRDD